MGLPEVTGTSSVAQDDRSWWLSPGLGVALPAPCDLPWLFPVPVHVRLGGQEAEGGWGQTGVG